MIENNQGRFASKQQLFIPTYKYLQEHHPVFADKAYLKIEKSYKYIGQVNKKVFAAFVGKIIKDQKKIIRRKFQTVMRQSQIIKKAQELQNVFQNVPIKKTQNLLLAQKQRNQLNKCKRAIKNIQQLRGQRQFMANFLRAQRNPPIATVKIEEKPEFQYQIKVEEVEKSK